MRICYDHDKKYWTVTAVRTSQIEMRAIYDLVSAKTGIATRAMAMLLTDVMKGD